MQPLRFPEPTQVSRFQTPSFTVLVGRSKKPYYVNESFLTIASPYFKQICSLEPEEWSKAITLPTELVATEIAFEKFLEYVYLGDYGLGYYALTYEGSFKEEMGMKLHAQVYVLAEKLLMRDLKGCALEKMIVTMTRAYTAEEGKIPRNTRDRLRASRTHSGSTSSSLFGSPAANTVTTGGLFGGSSKPSKSVTSTPTTRSKIRAAYTKAENTENTRDPMRVLIARFAASCSDEYKKERVFLKLLRGGGQFAEDLVLELAGVDKVRSDEKRLP
ncbi:hypothetical protein RUND412_003716 [Rhizina undulata]